MKTLRIVLDTNVIVSALITKGKCRLLISKIIEDGHKIVISKEIIDEFLSVMKLDKFRKYVSYEDATKYILLIAVNADIIDIKTIMNVCNDNMDNNIISTAVDGDADYIVTGDKKDLLPIRSIDRIKIVSVDEILNILMRSQ